MENTKENTFTSVIKDKCLGKVNYNTSPLAAEDLIPLLQEKIIVWEEAALKLAEIADALKAENVEYKKALDIVYDKLNN